MHQDNLYVVAALRHTPLVLSRFLRGRASNAPAQKPKDTWSLAEVVCHLRDNEERALERMRLMRDRDDPLIESYDQNAWAKERNYASADIDKAFGDFKQFREQHLVELAVLAPDAWERTGRHAERGTTSIQIQTVRLLCHDIVHMEQISELLGT